MAFPPDFIDLLKDRVRVSEVVGRKVSLKKDGREFKGLCPFHNEKTPSFYVNDEKGFYHCFGCGAHGSSFDFLMETEGRSFPEAAEELAAIAGVDVPVQTPQDKERQERRASLHDVLEAACVYFERQLSSPAGAEARAYLDQRQLTQATRRKYRLGYSPKDRTQLTQFLVKEGFDKALVVEAGLHRPPQDGKDGIDYFRDRVIFPITDRRDRVIGFGGRVMGDGQPKYLNSPETPLFDKGRVLYGLAQARDAARKADAVVVAEGYMDVIALSQAGIEYAVAPLGTALTEQQLEELWKLAPEPLLCFDGDAAGVRAAARAADRALPLLQAGQSLRFVQLPEGQDPDDVLKAGGRKAMDDLLIAAKPLVEMLVDLEIAQAPIDTPERKADLKKRVRQKVAKIADGDIRGLYGQAVRDRLDEALGFGPKDPQQGQGRSFRPWAPRSPYRRGEVPVDPYQVRRYSPNRESVTQTKNRRQQELLTLIMVKQPILVDAYWESISALALTNSDLDRLREAILGHLAEQDLDAAMLADRLVSDGFETTLDQLAGSDVARDHRSLFDEEGVTACRGVLDDLLKRGLLQSMMVELEDAKAAVIAEPTESNHARLSALREACRRMAQESEEAPISGEMSTGATRGSGSFF